MKIWPSGSGRGRGGPPGRKHKGWLVPLCVAAAAGLLSLGYRELVRVHHTPARTPARLGSAPIIVQLPRGLGLAEVAHTLERAGVVRYPRLFLLAAFLQGHGRDLQAGEYEFLPQDSPADVLRKLVQGDVLVYGVTVPEGFTLRQIARLLHERQLADPDRVLRLAQDPEFAHSSGIEADSLEGYLFPDTYRLTRADTEAETLRRMVRNFRSKFGTDRQRRAAELGLTVHEAITLASIIEKETWRDEERPVISSVFHNRLKKRMRLRADPTVLYALGRDEGPLTRSDLEAPSPYNTYRVKGLPPGPIANPGLASIDAALNPAETEFLYFVARTDGAHEFSRTLREHNRAVRLYRKGEDDKERE